MSLLAVTYVKGRPGATTTALGLAAVAPPHSRPVLIECDPAGGDMTLRHNLAARPSVVDLAAAARASSSTDEVFGSGTQLLHLGDVLVEVVVAPAGGAQTRAALPELIAATRGVLNPADRLVVADCGRLDVASPVWPVVRTADAVVVLVRARADEVAHLREHLGDLLDTGVGRLVVALAPGGTYSAGEVAEVLGTHLAEELVRDRDEVEVYGPLPADRRGAALLGGDLVAGRRWQRLPLLTALDRLYGVLSPYLGTAPGRAADAVVEVPR